VNSSLDRPGFFLDFSPDFSRYFFRWGSVSPPFLGGVRVRVCGDEGARGGVGRRDGCGCGCGGGACALVPAARPAAAGGGLRPHQEEGQELPAAQAARAR